MIFRANIQPSCRCGSGKRAAFSKAAGRLLHRPCWRRERSINLPVYPPWRTTTPLSRAALDASDLRIRRVAAQHPVESHRQSPRCRHFGHSFGFARRNSGDDDDCGVGLPKEHHGSEVGGQTRSCRYATRSMAMNFSDGHKYDFLRVGRSGGVGRVCPHLCPPPSFTERYRRYLVRHNHCRRNTQEHPVTIGIAPANLLVCRAVSRPEHQVGSLNFSGRISKPPNHCYQSGPSLGTGVTIARTCLPRSVCFFEAS